MCVSGVGGAAQDMSSWQCSRRSKMFSIFPDLCTVESSDSEQTATTSRAARSRVKGKKGPGGK